MYAALQAFDGVVADKFRLVVGGLAEGQEGGVFVHRLEAQFHAWAYRSAEVSVVVGEDVVGDACPDVRFFST